MASSFTASLSVLPTEASFATGQISVRVRVAPDASAVSEGYAVNSDAFDAFFSVAPVNAPSSVGYVEDYATGNAVSVAGSGAFVVAYSQNDGDGAGEFTITLSGLAPETPYCFLLTYNDTTFSRGPVTGSLPVYTGTPPVSIVSTEVAPTSSASTYDITINFTVLPSFNFSEYGESPVQQVTLAIGDDTTYTLVFPSPDSGPSQPLFFAPGGTGDGSRADMPLPLSTGAVTNMYTCHNVVLNSSDNIVVLLAWTCNSPQYTFALIAPLFACIGASARVLLADGSSCALSQLRPDMRVALPPDGTTSTRVVGVRRMPSNLPGTTLVRMPAGGQAGAHRPLLLTAGHAVWLPGTYGMGTPPLPASWVEDAVAVETLEEGDDEELVNVRLEVNAMIVEGVTLVGCDGTLANTKLE